MHFYIADGKTKQKRTFADIQKYLTDEQLMNMVEEKRNNPFKEVAFSTKDVSFSIEVEEEAIPDFRFCGYIIKSEPNETMRVNKETGKREKRNGYACSVYKGDEEKYRKPIYHFWLVEGETLENLSQETLYDAIRVEIEKEYFFLKSVEWKEAAERYADMLCVTARSLCSDNKELYDKLSRVLGLTDDEIRKIGFTFLAPYFDREKYAKTIALRLIDDGTFNTESGNWIVDFEAIDNDFGTDLANDPEMVELIERHLDPDIVADCYTNNNSFDMMFYLAYCGTDCE